MRAIVKDTTTGQQVSATGLRSFDWAEGNWSCDCNRATLFPPTPSYWRPVVIGHGPKFCLGAKRFIVIAASMCDPADYPYSLRDLNFSYPLDLLEAHGVPV
jgi:hypothetical protein